MTALRGGAEPGALYRGRTDGRAVVEQRPLPFTLRQLNAHKRPSVLRSCSLYPDCCHPSRFDVESPGRDTNVGTVVPKGRDMTWADCDLVEPFVGEGIRVWFHTYFTVGLAIGCDLWYRPFPVKDGFLMT